MPDDIVLQPLDRELTFCADEVPLLTAQALLPHWENRSSGRFNRYYRACCDSFQRLCRQELFPRAESAYYRARENASPIPQWQAQLSTTITLRRDHLISLHTDTQVVGMPRPYTARRGDTWDLQHQLPLPLSLFFPAGTNLRRRLCDAAAQEIARQEADGLARYYPGWERMLPRAFRPQRFFLSEEGLHFFFPLHAIAPAVEGCPTFFVPYDREKGPFPAERPKSFPEGCPK